MPKTETAVEAPAGTPAAGDATAEELEAVASIGITLDQLRAARALAPMQVLQSGVEEFAVDDYDPREGICGACFPAGWPDRRADHAECEHGEWDREKVTTGA